jgi:hypothetical protein
MRHKPVSTIVLTRLQKRKKAKEEMKQKMSD